MKTFGKRLTLVVFHLWTMLHYLPNRIKAQDTIPVSVTCLDEVGFFLANVPVTASVAGTICATNGLVLSKINNVLEFNTVANMRAVAGVERST